MDTNLLKQIASSMMVSPKGLLAADESAKTIQKRFDKINLTSTPETNLAYRKMLFSTPGVEEYISGIILFDETIRQQIDGKPMCQYLSDKGILPGIKVDKGAVDFEGHFGPARNVTQSVAGGEKVTEGLDGLDERMKEYEAMGAKFAKWRAVITIGEGIPTDECLMENAKRLAEYAYICQQNNIVPIVEPEVLLDGAHTIEQCFEAEVRTLTKVFEELKNRGVDLEGMILKPSMVMSGKDSSIQADSKKVANLTTEALKNSVPAEVPGVAFLSGGQSDESAIENLSEIAKIGGPWTLTFSYSRGLQNAPMMIWAGKEENVKAAQDEFLKRCQKASLARVSQTS